MAHAIIFFDRAPRNKDHDFTTQFYAYSAGAYKVASVLRHMGLDVLVVPNCLNLTWQGVQAIVNQNRDNLLWVGLSTTFFVVETPPEIIKDYRQQWVESDLDFIDADMLCIKTDSNYWLANESVWGARELGRISHWLEREHQVPFLIGGSSADVLTQSKLKHRNTYVITGYAETWVKSVTQARLANHQADMPFYADNKNYDDHDFKQSTIIWQPEDMIGPDDWLPIEVARGCAFNCAYCNYPRRGEFDAYKSPKCLRDEIVRNYELFGVTRYNLVDDLYNDSKEKVKRLHDEVWTRLPFQPEWTTQGRLDLLWKDPESAALIRDSGCRYVSFGIETLHDRAGRKVGKGLGKKRIIETLEMLKEVWGQQTLVGACMIAGLPFEPLDSIKESMDWSVTTDLLHSPSWQPMHLIPPSQGLSSVKNQIENDFDKYGVTWINDHEWINSEGVTNTVCDMLCEGYEKKLSTWNIRFGSTVYVDMRVLGFSHDKIANWRHTHVTQEEFDQCRSDNQRKIMDRLHRVRQVTL